MNRVNTFGYHANIPEDIREVIMWLCQDLAALNGNWQLYLDLFGTRETAELLSDTAQAAFQMIEESLRNDMTMSISRLGDPALSAGKDTLSLNALRSPCGAINDVRSLLDRFLDASKPFRELRNKRVAHNDLNTRLKPVDNPLPGISKAQVEEVLELASKILNAIYGHYANGELMFTLLAKGTGEDLIFRLREGKESAE